MKISKIEAFLRYLDSFDSQLSSSPDDPSFFLDIAQFVEDISTNKLVEKTLQDLIVKRNTSGENIVQISLELYQRMKDILDKLIKNPKFPRDDIQIVNELKLLKNIEDVDSLRSKKGWGGAAYITTIKILEKLDELGLTDLTNEWRMPGPNPEFPYSVTLDNIKYSDKKTDLENRQKASAWSALNELLLVPMAIYEREQIHENFNKTISEKGDVMAALDMIGISGEMRLILKKEHRSQPIIFKRSDYLYFFRKLKTYLISELTGSIKTTSFYDDDLTDYTIPNLIKIDSKDRYIKYIGQNSSYEWKFTTRTQGYVMLLELCKSDGNKLKVETIYKCISDPDKCDLSPEPGPSTGPYDVVKAAIGYLRRKFGFTEEELWLKNNFVGLKAHNK